MNEDGLIVAQLRTVSRRLWHSAGFVEILPFAVSLGWIIVGDSSRAPVEGWWPEGRAHLAGWAALVLLLLGLATAVGSWALEAVDGESQREATSRRVPCRAAHRRNRRAVRGLLVGRQTSGRGCRRGFGLDGLGDIVAPVRAERAGDHDRGHRAQLGLQPTWRCARPVWRARDLAAYRRSNDPPTPRSPQSPSSPSLNGPWVDYFSLNDVAHYWVIDNSQSATPPDCQSLGASGK